VENIGHWKLPQTILRKGDYRLLFVHHRQKKIFKDLAIFSHF
jgi:hypothetical protein